MTNQNNQNNLNDQEIDLNSVFNNFLGIFGRLGNLIKNIIKFIIRNIFKLVLITIIGFALGYYLDIKNDKFKQKIIVIPNFGSIDYLYNKIDLINSKIKSKDLEFLKQLGITNIYSLSEIKIQPIIDPYSFIKNNESNFDLIKLMSEDVDMNKVLKDPITSKNYYYHEITFHTKGKETADIVIDRFLEFINDSDYFKIIQKNIIENVHTKIDFNKQTIEQINNILKKFENVSSNSNASKDQLVYYNENTQLNDVIKNKDILVREISNSKIDLVNFQKIIKDTSIQKNIAVVSKNKFIFPVLFLFLFGIVTVLISVIKKSQLRK